MSIRANQHTRRATIGPWVKSITGLGAGTVALAIFVMYLPWDFDVAWALEMSMYGLVAGVGLGMALGLLVGIGAAAHRTMSQSTSVVSHLKFIRAWGLLVCVTLVGALLIFSRGSGGIGKGPGQIVGATLSAGILLAGVGLAYWRAPRVIGRYLSSDATLVVGVTADAREAIPSSR